MKIQRKLFIFCAVIGLASISCKPSTDSETKKLKNNFYGNPNESGVWQKSESSKARESMDDKTLVLTFDDGPRGFTNRILDFLKKERLNATFFVIGNLLKNPDGSINKTYSDIVKRAHREGHIIGNHTFTHGTASNDWLKVENKPEAFRDELLAADDVLTQLLGKDARRFFRPPGGWWLMDETKLVLENPRFADYLGPVGWNVGGGPLGPESASDHECWAMGLSPKACADKYLIEIEKNGKGIVLFHDVDERTADMFINHIYPEIKKKGYKVIGLDDIPYYKNQIGQVRENQNNSESDCYKPSKLRLNSDMSYKVFHGSTGTNYDAVMKYIPKPSGARDGFRYYFNLKHSDGDESTLGISTKSKNENLSGERFAISWNKSLVVPLNLQWSCDKWVGNFNHSDGFKETLSIQPNR
jgi:peptidoglycan/xylan/chitin deacetylase (PgdA/CDA1 family)